MPTTRFILTLTKMIIYDNRKRKKDPKPNADQRRLQAEWEELLKKHATKPAARPRFVKPVVKHVPTSQPKIQSLNAWVTGPVSTKQTPKYTGTKIIGIGTMHKSNAVPVFSDEEAIDIARMRRG